MKRIKAFTIYYEYVLDNTELQLPNSFDEGLLHKQLFEIANMENV